MLKVAILDDYQNVSQQFVDLKNLSGKYEFKIFSQPFIDEADAIEQLGDFEALLIMRERTAISKNLIDNLNNLKYIITSGSRNKAIDLKAAKERYQILREKIEGEVLLLHGRMKEEEKFEIMEKFKYEDYKVLVTTTVIEVGIDIPNATTLIIEHAERYGLAQLHQLRGRIGRSNLQSTCILLFKKNLSNNAMERIKKMKETNDGFEIAEKDLEIRGAGEILWKKQSGIPSFSIADLGFDSDLLEVIRQKVDEISKIDPKLESKNGLRLRNLLYLYEKDIAIKTLKAG